MSRREMKFQKSYWSSINTIIEPKEMDFWLFKHCTPLNYFRIQSQLKLKSCPKSFHVLLLKLLIQRSPQGQILTSRRTFLCCCFAVNCSSIMFSIHMGCKSKSVYGLFWCNICLLTVLSFFLILHVLSEWVANVCDILTYTILVIYSSACVI